ncbi:hypothetical protein GCM10020220_083460 [Nonomuraea rubra]
MNTGSGGRSRTARGGPGDDDREPAGVMPGQDNSIAAAICEGVLVRPLTTLTTGAPRSAASRGVDLELRRRPHIGVVGADHHHRVRLPGEGAIAGHDVPGRAFRVGMHLVKGDARTHFIPAAILDDPVW